MDPGRGSASALREGLCPSTPRRAFRPFETLFGELERVPSFAGVPPHNGCGATQCLQRRGFAAAAATKGLCGRPLATFAVPYRETIFLCCVLTPGTNVPRSYLVVLCAAMPQVPRRGASVARRDPCLSPPPSGTQKGFRKGRRPFAGWRGSAPPGVQGQSPWAGSPEGTQSPLVVTLRPSRWRCAVRPAASARRSRGRPSSCPERSCSWGTRSPHGWTPRPPAA